MSEKSIEIGKRIKGAMMENEDWWRLIIADDDSRWVEHEWSHVNRFGKGAPDSGLTRVSIEEFLASDASDGLKHKLTEALKAHS